MTPIVPERAIRAIWDPKHGIQQSKKGIFECYRGKFTKIYNLNQFNISLCIFHSKHYFVHVNWAEIQQSEKQHVLDFLFQKYHSSNFRNVKQIHQTRHRQISEKLDHIDNDLLKSVFSLIFDKTSFWFLNVIIKEIWRCILWCINQKFKKKDFFIF